MSPEMFLKVAIDPGLAVLPESMRSNDARRFLLAICLQESALKYRRQIKGPARGFPMFEINGLRGVLTHRSSKELARSVLVNLELEGADSDVAALHMIFEFNDALSIAFARLLIFTLPHKLPTNAAEAWKQYISAWRPGRPHESAWLGNWTVANAAVSVLP
jgi:hypothetical protein